MTSTYHPWDVTTDPQVDEILQAEVHDVEARHPRWHTYLSDARRAWAVHVHSFGAEASLGCGVTLEADSASCLDAKIAVWERQHPGNWGTAA